MPATPPPSEETTPDRVLELRLQSLLVVLMLIGLLMALPFILMSGAVFFLPLTAALVLTVALSPLADWLVRLGLPNALASLVAIAVFIAFLAFCGFLILQPTAELIASLPRLINVIAAQLDQFQGSMKGLGTLAEKLAVLTGKGKVETVVIAGPSMLEQAAYATPTLLFESVLTLLTAYFMVESRVRMRRRLLLDRSGLDTSLRAAHTLRDVQERVGAYLATVTLINFGVGIVVGVGAWLFGLSSPVMWGGLAALLNYLPYFGPLIMVALLGAFGLGTSESLIGGLLPAAAYFALHSVEANLLTPAVLGRRFTINPVAILIAISFFTWVWGGIGAILSVPILIILLALFEHTGRPNLVGFVFGEELFSPPHPENSADQPG